MFAPVAVLAVLVVVPEPTLPELLAEYRSLGLPLPPAGAKLVKYYNGWREGDGKTERKIYGLGLLIRPRTATTGPAVLVGTDTVELIERGDEVHELEPNPAGVRDVPPDGHLARLLAVQCLTLGWGELAAHLIDRARATTERFPARALLAVSAWHYWVDQVCEPKIDRRPVAERLRRLLRQYSLLDTDKHRALLRSLDLALAPSTAKPGSIEAMIDALVDEGTDDNVGAFGDGYTPGPAYWRLAEQGFDAVPALIAHLDDDRRTRGMMTGFNNFRSWHLRVGHLAGDLLEELAGETLDRGTTDESVGGGWLRRLQAYRVRPEAARAWWAKAQAIGEEAHVTARVLSAPRQGSYGDGVSEHLLRVIRVRHPKRLPELYRSVLDKPSDWSSSMLASTVQHSTLPIAEKVALLVRASRHKDFGHRLAALDELKGLDPAWFQPLLLDTLAERPANPAGPYWSKHEGQVAGLVIETDDPRAWAELTRVAKRIGVEQRIQILAVMGYSGGPRRAERLRFMCQFWDDQAVYDTNRATWADDSAGGSEYARIEVRNYVAVAVVWALGVDVPFNPKRTAAEWADLRRTVAARLEQELAKSKK